MDGGVDRGVPQEQTRDSDILPFGLQDMAAPVHGFMLNTGAKIPTVGLGTWQAEPGVVGQAIIAAVKAGYRHIDCARIYGNENDQIGLDLKKLFDDGVVKREELFITSKLWFKDVPEALEATLNDLQLDYLNLYLAYSPLGSPGTSSIWTHGNVLDNPTIKKVAEVLGWTPAQFALRWGTQMGHSVLPKSTSEKRINENLRHIQLVHS
ncbi:putative aldose reductase [Dioscorea sansibarensis]